MGSLTKTAGITGTFTYTLNVDPFSAPVMRIYSDAARSVLVHGPVTLTPGASNFQFVATYPSTLAAGTYYLKFSTVINDGDAALDDIDDTLILTAPVGSVDEGYGICAPWATLADMCGPCTIGEYEPSVVDADTMTRMLVVASEVLSALTGNRFTGECSQVIRPCGNRLAGDVPVEVIAGNWLGGTLSWGAYLAIGGCSCHAADQCGCVRLSSIDLGENGVVVGSVSQVKVDGAVVDPSLYRLDEGRWLVRLPDADGSRPGWPCCGRVDLPDSEPDTFSITYTSGQAPPQSGVLAAATLACELAMACTNPVECRLPRRVQSVARQGVSLVFSQLLSSFGSPGAPPQIGLNEVDLFLAAYAPSHRSGYGGISSIDYPQSYRTVG